MSACSGAKAGVDNGETLKEWKQEHKKEIRHELVNYYGMQRSLIVRIIRGILFFLLAILVGMVCLIPFVNKKIRRKFIHDMKRKLLMLLFGKQHAAANGTEDYSDSSDDSAGSNDSKKRSLLIEKTGPKYIFT